MKHKMFKPI